MRSITVESLDEVFCISTIFPYWEAQFTQLIIWGLCAAAELPLPQHDFLHGREALTPTY